MPKPVVVSYVRRRNAAIIFSRNLLIFLLVLALVAIAVLIVIIEVWPASPNTRTDHEFSLYNADHSRVVSFYDTSPLKPVGRQSNCSFHSCLDVLHCGYNDETRIRVYVYPYQRYVDQDGRPMMKAMSRQFQQIVETVVDSEFYTSDPHEACLFLPTLDLLNQESLNLTRASQVLTSLPHWNGGTNHLLFNMIPGAHPGYTPHLELDTGQALVAGAGLSTWTYRRTFDVSIPEYSPLLERVTALKRPHDQARPYQLISAQLGLHPEYLGHLRRIQSQASTQFLLLDRCGDEKFNPFRRCIADKTYVYPEILQDSDFCLVLRGNRYGHPSLSDALMMACIPVVVSDGYIMPFEHVLDWSRAAVFIREANIPNIVTTLTQFSPVRVSEMRKQAAFYWATYFKSMRAITTATLQVLNDRVFPHYARTYQQWNDEPNPNAVYNPLFLRLMPAESSGFTAVILTYDRLESLFTVIRQVAKASSLAKVVVVWNNQLTTPPPMSSWPKIGKPIKVIRTTHNHLSNRFYPYPDIETDCILALDDDIIMLTADELEFGYQVWREFSDRLVGFPSRLHQWDNGTNTWRYQSEWTNDISMVLTGAAFYHKYFGYLYTTKMPKDIKTWVDAHMNCEDIAMNFVIANATGKSPIKVTPRKKFTCPTCVSSDMLSMDMGHLLKRSECITRFAKSYASVPLKSVEFRADPVLYRDNITEILKLYRDVGSL